MSKKLEDNKRYYISCIDTTIYHEGKRYRKYRGVNYNENYDTRISKDEYISMFKTYAIEAMKGYSAKFKESTKDGTYYTFFDETLGKEMLMLINMDTCNLQYIYP